MVGPYADSSELSHTTTLSYTTDTSSLAWNKLCDHFGGAALTLCSGKKAVHQGWPALGVWSFSIVSGPRRDGRALCQLLQVVPHHHSLLHHGHHLPWLGITFAIIPGCCAPPWFWQESSPPRWTSCIWPTPTLHPILESRSTVLLLLLLLLLCHAKGTPPGFWKGVEWRGLVKD